MYLQEIFAPSLKRAQSRCLKTTSNPFCIGVTLDPQKLMGLIDWCCHTNTKHDETILHQSGKIRLQWDLGNLNFNKTPLAPPSCLIVAHEHPQDRGTWDDHEIKGPFIWPVKYHHQNHNVYILVTRCEQEGTCLVTWYHTLVEFFEFFYHDLYNVVSILIFLW